MTNYQTIGVIGGGAWGTALAQTLAVAGRDVTLWAFEDDCVETINERRENTLYLKGVKLNHRIKATSVISHLGDLDAVLSVAPAQHTRKILESFVPSMRDAMPIVLCSKGIEISTRQFMSDVLTEVAPTAVPAVLSGPSFAIDVAQGLPTAVTLACENEAIGANLVQAIAAPTFRPYLANDVLGTEIGGAVKNVLAIVCGIVLGKGLGRSGSSEQSRNMSCGLALGRGQSLEDIMAARNSVTEGVASAPALKEIAAQTGVDMPICTTMADILAGDIDVDSAIIKLLSREHKKEI